MRDESWLDAAQRRRVSYLHLQDLLNGREVVEVWSGRADEQGAKLLLARGAKRVTVVAQGVGSGGTPDRTGLPDASADLFLALDADAATMAGIVREARRVLRPDGLLVVSVASRDRPGAVSGASYYDVVDACVVFARVQMIGVAPFAGATLVEYGVADPEPILDGTLVERGERVEHYLAVAGPDRRGDFGYGVVQVPVSSIAAVAPAAAGVDTQALRESIARLEAELANAKRGVARAPVPEARVEHSEGAKRALSEALERHAGEMRAREAELAERDAYIRELEVNGRRINEVLGQLDRAEAARAAAETKERDSQRRIAELEGKLLRGGGASNVVSAPSTSGASSDEVEVLKAKLAQAEAESWKQLKGRSDAEAATAEIRDDMVRKLKDARKLATVELTRAMEEATKKAIRLREELDRSEAERKAAVAKLAAVGDQAVAPAAAVDEHSHRLAVARAREEGEASALAAKAAGARALADAEAARAAAEASARDAEARVAQLRGRLVGVERTLAAAERERDEARAQLAGEQARAQALTGGDVASATREAAQAKLLAEHAQEQARLRAELDDKEQHIFSLERERPPRAEVERVRTESAQLRARMGELDLELKRRDAAIERTASAAAHERARSERLVASERQALAERNDARARGAEIHAKVAAIESERDRLVSALAMTEAKLHKAENEIDERRERVRKLKRELAESEQRAAAGIERSRALEAVRARVLALEAAVAGEARQLAGIEAALRAP